MNPAGPLLRDCEARDLAAITAIYRNAVLTGYGSFEIEPPDEAEMGARWRGLVAGASPFLVAEWQGEVAGYAYAGPYHRRAGYRLTVEDSIYVAEAFQGRGIGRALLHRLIEIETAAGLRQMVAVIGDSRNEASIRLHLSEGFAHVGTLREVGFKKGRWLDVVLMQRQLAPHE